MSNSFEERKNIFLNILIQTWSLKNASISYLTMQDIGRINGFSADETSLYFNNLSNILTSLLDNINANQEFNDDFEQLSFSKKISYLIKIKIEKLAKMNCIIENLIRCASHPINHPHCVKALYHDVDFMIKKAGDRSTDFSYYTKRGVLYGIYVATLVHFNYHKNISATFDFVDHRLNDVKKIPIIKGFMKHVFDSIINFSGKR